MMKLLIPTQDTRSGSDFIFDVQTDYNVSDDSDWNVGGGAELRGAPPGDSTRPARQPVTNLWVRFRLQLGMTRNITPFS